MLTPFHLAIAVRDIDEARAFYGGLLGCAEGRSDEDWVDFDLFGHQLVCHRGPALAEPAPQWSWKWPTGAGWPSACARPASNS